jgi:ABC-type lipoprotein release transport system permease subunit
MRRRWSLSRLTFDDMIVMVLAASFIPAWQASRLDPEPT